MFPLTHLAATYPSCRTPQGPPNCLCDGLQEFDKFARAVVDFALLGLPAAVVNSGLKFMQKNLELSFQQR